MRTHEPMPRVSRTPLAAALPACLIVLAACNAPVGLPIPTAQAAPDQPERMDRAERMDQAGGEQDATAGALSQPADRSVELPVSRITLYRSGVGAFERRGVVREDATVRLRVSEGQLNDLLKSLLVLDRGGGAVSEVRYGSREPLARRLAALGVDLSGDPSLADLLRRLRGASVVAQLADERIAGSITGVEGVQRAVDEAVVEGHALTLFTGSGLRRVHIADLVSLDFADRELARDVGRALALLAEERDEGVRTVQVASRGRGERELVLRYVHEMPVWKPAYRLSLGEGGPTLQAWAIVENTTEADWQGVSLSLVASQPVGFTMDLQTPLYVARPDLPVPISVPAAPKLYAGQRADQARAQAPADRGGWSRGESRGRSAFADSELAEGGLAMAAGRAVSAEIGRAVVLTIDEPVSVQRQQSAMIPILTEPVKARPLSIYRQRDGGDRAMLGVELTNTTGTPLIDGPVAVYDGVYAGDAQVGLVPPGATRLLAYAVDTDLRARVRTDGDRSTIDHRVSRGVLITRIGRTATTTYVLRNEDDAERTVLVEHAPNGGWELVSPDDGVRTDAGTLRFERAVPAGGTLELAVEERTTQLERVALVEADLPDLIERITRGGRAGEALLEALRKGGELNRDVQRAERTIASLESEVSSITADQKRIRENMRAIDADTDLYRRYLGTLNEQEDRLAALRQRLGEARQTLEAARKARSAYFASLSVQ